MTVASLTVKKMKTLVNTMIRKKKYVLHEYYVLHYLFYVILALISLFDFFFLHLKFVHRKMTKTKTKILGDRRRRFLNRNPKKRKNMW